MDESSLSHTRWKCQYHIVIVPKYRRKAIYGELRKEIGEILRRLCEYKKVEIIEAHAMPDLVHFMLQSQKQCCYHQIKVKETFRKHKVHSELRHAKLSAYDVIKVNGTFRKLSGTFQVTYRETM